MQCGKQTVVHTTAVSWYREEPEIAFGFSGRAIYALGYSAPNYPVPATADVNCTVFCFEPRPGKHWWYWMNSFLDNN